MDYIIWNSAEMQTVDGSLFLLANCMSDHIKQEYTVLQDLQQYFIIHLPLAYSIKQDRITQILYL